MRADNPFYPQRFHEDFKSGIEFVKDSADTLWESSNAAALRWLQDEFPGWSHVAIA